MILTGRISPQIPQLFHEANEMDQRQIIMLYAISGTILLLFIVIAIFLIQRRRNRLNWYDQNLLEIATSPPNYVRCKALPRLDTEDDRAEDEQARRPKIRKQSRIHEINRHSFEMATIPTGDLTGIFTVPKSPRIGSSSMFNSLDQCKIDRALYQNSIDEEVAYDEKSGQSMSCGSLKLSIHIDVNLNLLTVSLKQATDLVAKRQDGFPNPYFKVMLDIPESPLPKIEHRSKICKNTQSPIVGEEFFFQIPNGNVNHCRLEIMVFDYDQFSVDECIGYCWLTLGRLSISPNKTLPTIFWAEVLPFDDDNGNGYGEILFSLTYLARAQRLTVNMFKARNLKTSDHNDTFSSIAIRISLLAHKGERRRLKRKKTSSKKNTRNPQFNESLTFTIPKNSLCDTILEFEAVHEYGTFGMGSRVLGRMELPLHKCRDLWRAIIREEKSQARWYSLDES